MAKKSRPVLPLPRYFSSQVVRARRFYLRGGPRSLSGVGVLGGGLEECRPDYLIDRPGFPSPILEFVAGGAGELVMQDIRHELVPGTVFTYGRGLAHCMASDHDRPLVKFFLVLTGHRASAMLKQHGLTAGTVIRVGHPDRIRRIFDDMIGFGLGDRTDREDCCRRAAEYLLMLIREWRLPTGQAAARSFATYERCRRHIEEHGTQLTSVREAADACHVDSAYLCRLFKRFGRERPLHYLQHVRMNYAMTQLQTTNRLIKDIAAELRFSDPANFTRTFQRWFGVPPRAIRSG